MRARLYGSLIALLLPLLFVTYLGVGAVPLSVNEIFAVLSAAVHNDIAGARAEWPQATAILLYIRLPRALAAVLVGAALALAGAASQGLFRNPLASPDILGISAGSSLGAVIAISTGLSMLHPLMLPLAAMSGAVGAAWVVYLLALRAGFGQQLLFVILAGLALSSLLVGATSALLLMAQQYEISQFIFWTMGGLEGRLWSHILWPALPLLIMAVLVLAQAKPLNLIALGEDNAHGIGLNVVHTQRLTLLACALLTALAIAMAGPVGFVGLMIPHLVRLLVGPDHRTLLPLCALTGAAFVLFADLLARILIAPHEIKVGILTALMGGSYFLMLLLRIQRQGQL